jgi:type IV pilus assembly protein PilE
MNKQQGFTLVELLMVVAIIAIIAAIAYPSYTGQVRKTRRAVATACLQQNAQFMERWYTSKLTYDGATVQPCQEVTQFYDVVVDVTSARAFTLTATPKGAQAGEKCGVLTLDEKGERGQAVGMSESACW